MRIGKIVAGRSLVPLLSLCVLAAPPAAAQLIGTVDYSDTFTLGVNGRANGVFGTPVPYVVEDPHGNPASSWAPLTNYSFNDIPGSFGTGPTVLAAATGNPGAATGVAQSGGGDFSFAYGLRTSYIVEMDAFISPGDRTDISSSATAGAGLGSPNSLSVFFRRDGIGANGIGLYPGNGVPLESHVLDEFGQPVRIGIADDNWHKLAVHFNQDEDRLVVYVDGQVKADLDLTVFAGGIYQSYSNAAVGAGGAGAFVDGKVLWFDNFQVGAPPGASNLLACFRSDVDKGPAPLSVSFDASCSSYEGEAPTYSWDFGDGSPAGSGETLEHVYLAGGTYTVTLTLTQGADSKSATREVRVFTSQLDYADNFDRPDGAVEGWTSASGAWRLSGNSLAIGPNNAAEGWIWAGSPAVSLPRTTTIEWEQFFLAPGTVAEVGRHAGLAFGVNCPTTRGDPGFSGYFVDWIDRASDRGLRFTRVDNGAFREIVRGQGAAAPADVPLEWKLEIDGNHIRLSADGTTYFDVVDSTYRGGLIGFWSWVGGQEVGFDNLNVDGSPLSACFTATPSTAVGTSPVRLDASCSAAFPGSGPITTYSWDFGDGVVDASGALVDHSYQFPGDYTVTLTVGDGTASASTTLLVKVAEPLIPFSDCFERDAGPVDGWTPALGTWSINADGQVETTTTAGEAFLYAGSPPRPLGAEFTAEVDWLLAGGSHPVVGRHAAVHFYWNTVTTDRFAGDSSGYVVFYIDRASDRGLTLARFDGATLTALNPPGGTPTLTEPPGSLRIEVDGPLIRVLADGEPIIEAEDSTYRSGYFALWSWQQQSKVIVDNVRIPPLSEVKPCDLAISCSLEGEPPMLRMQGTTSQADSCANSSPCECTEIEVLVNGVPAGVFPAPVGLEVTLPLSALPGLCLQPGAEVELGARCVSGGNRGSAGSCNVTCPAPQGGLQRAGDCNQDGLRDISDAICLFGFLFLGSPTQLPCGDGQEIDPANRTLLDHNSDALIDISDGISLLAYLFTAGPPPAAGEGCVRIVGCEEQCVP